MAKLGGLYLPKTLGTYFTFTGLSPGYLGEDIKNGNFQTATIKTTSDYASLKIGICK